MALRLKTDGLLNIPEHYHNAVFYCKHFNYFNPYTEGQFKAMQRDLRMAGLYKATWAVELNCVVEKKSGKYWKWFTDEQVLFVSERLEQYFKSREYKERVEEAYQQYHFEIDHDKLDTLMRAQPVFKTVPELFE